MQKRLAIGIDLGGTQLRAALVDRDGAIVSRDAIATDVAGGPRQRHRADQAAVRPRSVPPDAAAANRRRRRVGAGAARQRNRHGHRHPDVAGLGGRSRSAPSLAEEFGLPVVVENDGIAAANGEWQFGSARGLRHFVYVTVSTGIGGGVVVDGRLLRGRRGMAGHVGHMIIEPGGPLCSCGAHGCFEALASGSALGPRRPRGGGGASGEPARQRTSAEADHRARHRRGGARRATASRLTLLDARRPGSASASATLCTSTARRRVIMGGGVSQAFDLLLPRIAADVPIIGHAGVSRRARSSPPRLATMPAWPAPRHSSGRGRDSPAERNATTSSALPRWKAGQVVPPDFDARKNYY